MSGAAGLPVQHDCETEARLARELDIKLWAAVARQSASPLYRASCCSRNVQSRASMKARCLLSAAPPWPPSIFS